MENILIAASLISIVFLFSFLFFGLVSLIIRFNTKQEKTWQKQHPDLALIALPVIYVQPYENGVIIQDSKQRLHYFTDRGYSWEPLDEIKL
ncbi:hypothetical protein [Phaeodactylibacter xiamenensis]|uniref:hypothetical protein n=1 Tax=Phaeodactylibacter xiamenensis TaxID=1524460 RepID=UPI0024A83C5E|nr:hypothetical protein [Phaeodactylibacter xiamenensis]